MSQRLAGKHIVITAAAAGIGRASALACAAAGARVTATDIDETGLASLAAENSNVATKKLDVTDLAAIEAFAKELANESAAVEVLFNCVGFVHHGTILDCAPEDWERSFSINTTSVYNMIRVFLPGMISAGQGNIINMSSVASNVIGVPNRFVYGASKAAIVGITKSVAVDFVKQGIRCNAICPATVESPSLEQRIRAQGNYDEVKAAFVSRQPMGRLGSPDEIAALVVYLASDESAYTTGVAHVIDGGWTMA